MRLLAPIQTNPSDSTTFTVRHEDGKQQKPPVDGHERNPPKIREWFRRRDEKDNLFCTHCKRWGHTIESYWEIHGKLEHLKNKMPFSATTQKLDGKENGTHGVPEKPKTLQGQGNQIEKIKEELDRLKAMLSATSLAFTSLVQSGEHLLFMALAYLISHFSTRWIVDCGARDRIAPDASKFSSYIPNRGSKKVLSTGGEILYVAGIGDVKLPSLGLLRNVLHVPQLKAHLISPQRLVMDLSYRFILEYNGCYFCDKVGQKIGHVKTDGRLLYFEEGGVQHCLMAQGYEVDGDLLLKWRADIFLYHFRFGHP